MVQQLFREKNELKNDLKDFSKRYKKYLDSDCKFAAPGSVEIFELDVEQIAEPCDFEIAGALVDGDKFHRPEPLELVVVADGTASSVGVVECTVGTVVHPWTGLAGTAVARVGTEVCIGKTFGGPFGDSRGQG